MHLDRNIFVGAFLFILLFNSCYSKLFHADLVVCMQAYNQICYLKLRKIQFKLYFLILLQCIQDYSYLQCYLYKNAMPVPGFL